MLIDVTVNSVKVDSSNTKKTASALGSVVNRETDWVDLSSLMQGKVTFQLHYIHS